MLSDIENYVKQKEGGGYYGKSVQVVDLLKSTNDFEGFCQTFSFESCWATQKSKK